MCPQILVVFPQESCFTKPVPEPSVRERENTVIFEIVSEMKDGNSPCVSLTDIDDYHNN